MTADRQIGFAGGIAIVALTSALVLASPRPGVTQESKARVARAPASRMVRLQGTWSADQGGQNVRGTWEMRFRVAGDFVSFSGAKARELQNFSGQMSIGGIGVVDRDVFGSVGAERIEFTLPANPKASGTANAAEFHGEGKVSDRQLSGAFESTEGLKGSWEGWWVVRAAEPALDASAEVGGER